MLLAIGRDEEETYQTIRLGLGRTVTDDEVDATIALLTEEVTRITRNDVS